ncbi:BrnT family toxin [Ancylobacter pratisalsi]|uniref:BrnT family toxin n=1 Tax=Ancylobacter pratisalsi TaxID=1745854 RepID=A0A6P1YM42_9HYPH|nr:BrnT family toxin [Ancylobacter pratisalsi]QIB34205.1 BrnT family toxin [Ancylobacter pratisalsi]
MGETDDFEWDDDKDAANRAKHGLPLPLAARLFDGRVRLDRQARGERGELRFETIAVFNETVLLRAWTWRGRRRRAISFRSANEVERRAYQEAIGGC